MTKQITVFGAALGLMCSIDAAAQESSGAAFTATGESCEEVTWSEEALEQYPRIASACREVMERDGDYFVRFEGEVRSVADRGGRVTVAFEDGDTGMVNPVLSMCSTRSGASGSPAE